LTDLPIKLSWLTNRLLYYRDRLATEIINFQGYAVLDDRLTYDLSTTSGHAICVLDRAITEMRKITDHCLDFGSHCLWGYQLGVRPCDRRGRNALKLRGGKPNSYCSSSFYRIVQATVHCVALRYKVGLFHHQFAQRL
jgi:hypothetical protein